MSTKICPWGAYFTFCKISPDLSKLYLKMPAADAKPNNRTEVMIQFPTYQHADRNSYDVVVCMAPLYLFERWAQLALAMEVWKHFGVKLVQIYVQSVLPDSYALLKAYEKEGFARIKTFPVLPKFGKFDPNLKVDWRAEAAALTDCFNIYRYSAKFVFFGSPDDLIFPKSRGPLIREFEFLSESHPKALAFRYRPKVISVHTAFAGIALKDLNFSEILQNTKAEFRDSTKYFVKGGNEQILGIDTHWPILWNKSLDLKSFVEIVPADFNRFAHMKYWIGKKAQTKKLNFTDFDHNLVSKRVVNRVQNRYGNFLDRNSIGTDKTLPKETYFPLIFDCHNRLMSRKNARRCHTYFNCALPDLDLKCHVAKGNYTEQRLSSGGFLMLVKTLNSGAELYTSLHGCQSTWNKIA